MKHISLKPVRMLALLLALLMVLSVVLVACNDDKDDNGDNPGGNPSNPPVVESPIAKARKAEAGSTVEVSGVVARLSYKTGMEPVGFILVDEGSSIYVYDAVAAASVKVGNKITISATKDYWILEKEQDAAAQFGYKGCNQLTGVTLISNDNRTDNAFPTEWITTTTVKDILETPVSEDITTKLFKVTALVKKVPGSDFVNYYFFDLDGETGNYSYSQCDGQDYAWLDPFDGKICTVYLTALNAKSSTTSCFFRFMPVAVYDEGFTFDLNKTAEHVVKYYGMDQILPSYTGNPNLELVTRVSSQLLGFTDATLSYSSGNTAVVKFTQTGDKTVMECLTPGTATVTVTGAYNGKTYSESITVTVSEASVPGSIGVKAAIDTALNETVLVEGIVGPSLVNRDGFYLIDSTGIIAVVVKDTSVFEGLEIGHRVVMEGERDCYHDGVGSHAGQTCITKATVKANFYGKNEYAKNHFVKDKTLADVAALSVAVDYSTTVYVVKATVSVVETPFYTNIELKDGGTTMGLYCSSAAQYGFLKAFAGQEVTVELAPCNWNNKTYYRGCVLSVTTADGEVFYNTLNFDTN